METVDLWLKDVLLDGKQVQVTVRGNRFAAVGDQTPAGGAHRIIDGRGRTAILPPFYNMHTHSAMTLLRGYADDMELFTWLSEHIWPLEAKLTPADIRLGNRLAAIEMIKSGTVFCNDSYWQPAEMVEAAEEFGMRAAVGMLIICGPDGEVLPTAREGNEKLLERAKSASRRIEVTLSPHAIYTVPEAQLAKAAEESRRDGRRVHIHVAETAKEVADCRAAHGGLTPVEYLDRLGLVNDKCIFAHCVHLTDRDIEILAERGAVISHQPVSNMKLVSGMFRFAAAKAAGCRIAIGTDGCASNNHLSMYDEMKFAALSAKMQSQNPSAGAAAEIWECATRVGAEVACGKGEAGAIAPGLLADAQLVELDRPELVADYHLTSNLVYAAHPDAVTAVICDGRVLMEDRRIPGEDEVLAAARALCRELPKR